MAENAQVRPSSEAAPPAKKARTEESEEELDEVQTFLNELENTQDSLNELNEKASEEILRVEQRFNELRKPHFSRRSQIVAKIPQFWVQALLSHPMISPIIKEQDEDALNQLVGINVEEFQDIKSGYKIDFIFNENEHFTNKVLTKTYNLGSNDGPSATTHTDIDWKPNMCLLVDYNGKRKRDSRPETFFGWFVDDQDQLGLGELIKDELWSDPVQYYMASMAEENESENGEDDGIDDEDDDEDEDGGAPYVFQNEDGTFVDAHGNPVEPYEGDSDDEDGSPAEYYPDEYAHTAGAAAAAGGPLPLANADNPVYISDGEDDGLDPPANYDLEYDEGNEDAGEEDDDDDDDDVQEIEDVDDDEDEEEEDEGGADVAAAAPAAEPEGGAA